MVLFDRTGVENLLDQLQEKNLFLKGDYFSLYKEDDQYKLLGIGSSAFVYDLVARHNPDWHYALKIIGLNNKIEDPIGVYKATQFQYNMSQESPYITRPIDLFFYEMFFDEKQNLIDANNITDVDVFIDNRTEGVIVAMIIFEKVTSLIEKDKYGNVKLLREELKDEREILKLANDIGLGLYTIHDNSFLHRDIKLENIFWNERQNKYCISDFGVSRFIDDEGAETILFTNGYGAPEIEKRLREYYDMRADIYSLGIVLYVLLNDLKFPFSNSYQVSFTQYDGESILPAPINASEKLASIIRKMCSYEPEDRYESVKDVLLEIEGLDSSFMDNSLEQYEDIETEYYTEDVELSDVCIDNDSDNNESDENTSKNWWEKDESELTRWEKKRIESIRKEDGIFYYIIYLIVEAVITFALCKIFLSKVSYILDFRLWLIPMVLILAIINLLNSVFYIYFNLIKFLAVLYLGYTFFALGPSFIQPFAILLIIYGDIGFLFSNFIGIFIWLALSV